MSLVTVAEAILDQDEIAKKHSLANKESVAQYADSIKIQLSDYHADAVLTICKLWMENTEENHWNGTNDYYHHVTTPLEHLDRAIEIDEIVKKEVQSEEDLKTLCSAINEMYVIHDYFDYEAEGLNGLSPYGDDLRWTTDKLLPDLPVDSRCRDTDSTDGIYAWAVPDPAYDNAPKFVMRINGNECDKEHPFVVVEFADDDYLHKCWDVTIEEEV